MADEFDRAPDEFDHPPGGGSVAVAPAPFEAPPQPSALPDGMDVSSFLRAGARTKSAPLPTAQPTVQQWAIRRGVDKAAAIAKARGVPLSSVPSEESMGLGAYDLAMEMAKRRDLARRKIADAAASNNPDSTFMNVQDLAGVPDVEDPELIDMAREALGLPPITKEHQGLAMAAAKGFAKAGKVPIDLLGGVMGPSSPVAAASRAGNEGINRWTEHFLPPTTGEQVAEVGGSLVPSLVQAGAGGGLLKIAGAGSAPLAVAEEGALQSAQGASTLAPWTMPLAASASSAGTEMAQNPDVLPEMLSAEGGKLLLRGAAEGVATRLGGRFEPFVQKFEGGTAGTVMPMLSEAGEGALSSGLQSGLTTGNTFSDVVSDTLTGAATEAAGAGVARVGQGMHEAGQTARLAYQNALRAQQGLPPLQAPVADATAPQPAPAAEMPGMVGPQQEADPELLAALANHPASEALGDPSRRIPALSPAAYADLRAPTVAAEEESQRVMDEGIRAKQEADNRFAAQLEDQTAHLQAVQAENDQLRAELEAHKAALAAQDADRMAKAQAEKDAAISAEAGRLGQVEQTRTDAGAETAVDTVSGGKLKRGVPLPETVPPVPEAPKVPAPPVPTPVPETTPPVPQAPVSQDQPKTTPPPAAPAPEASPVHELAGDLPDQLANSEPASQDEIDAAVTALFGEPIDAAPAEPAKPAAPAPELPPAGPKAAPAPRTPTVLAPSKATKDIGIDNRQSAAVDDNPDEQVTVTPEVGKPRTYGVVPLPNGKWGQWGPSKFGASRRGAHHRILDKEGNVISDWLGAGQRRAEFDTKEAALDDLRRRFQAQPTLEQDSEEQARLAVAAESNLRRMFKVDGIEWSDDPAVRQQRVGDHKTMSVDRFQVYDQMEDVISKARASVSENTAISDRADQLPAVDPITTVSKTSNLSRRGATNFRPTKDSPVGKMLDAIDKHVGAALSTPKHWKAAREQLMREGIIDRTNPEDMGSAALSSLVLPSHVANTHEEFAPVKDAATERMRAIHEDASIAARGAPELMHLSDADKAAVNRVLGEQRASGAYFSDEQLKEQGLNPTQIKAVNQQRDLVGAIRENIKQAAFHTAGFDPQSTDDFARTVEAMKKSGDPKAASAEALLEEVRGIDEMSRGGYTPYRRPSGQYVVYAKNADGKTIYSTRAKTKAEAEQLARAAKEQYGNAEQAPVTISDQEAIDLGYSFGATPEQLAKIATRAGMSPGAMAEMMQKVAPKLTEQGVRSHLLHSDDVPGFDPDHVKSVQRTYLASVMAKHNAEFKRISERQLDAMSKAGKSELSKYTKTYMEQQLEPESKLANAVRAGTFFTTVALKAGTMATNLTQPMLFHAPELIDLGANSLAAHVKVATSMMNQLTAIPRAALKAAFDARALGTKEAARQFSPTEAMITSYEKREPKFGKILRTMADRGELGNGMMELFTETKTATETGLDRVSRILSAPFAETERVNRMAAAKTAFDLYNAKKGDKGWWEHARKRGYRGPIEGDEAGQSFVEWAVGRSNFEYGRANRPLVGGGRIGGTDTKAPALGASVYALKHYQTSALGTVLRLMKNLPQDHEARKAFSAFVVGLLAAGGLTGLPFVAQGYSLARDVASAAGVPADRLHKQLSDAGNAIQPYVGDNAVALLQGGVGRLVGSPSLEAIGQRAGLQSVVPSVSSYEQAAGVPVAQAGRVIRDVGDVVRTTTSGGVAERPALTPAGAISNLVSSVTGAPVSDIQRAVHQSRTGDVTDRSGRTVPGATISAAGTAAGLSDPKAAVLREAQEAKKGVGAQKADAKAGVVRDLVESIRNPDMALRKAAVTRVREYNAARRAEGDVANLITPGELRASILSFYSNMEEGPLSVKAIRSAAPTARPQMIELRRWVEAEKARGQNAENPGE